MNCKVRSEVQQNTRAAGIAQTDMWRYAPGRWEPQQGLCLSGGCPGKRTGLNCAARAMSGWLCGPIPSGLASCFCLYCEQSFPLCVSSSGSTVQAQTPCNLQIGGWCRRLRAAGVLGRRPAVAPGQLQPCAAAPDGPGLHRRPPQHPGRACHPCLHACAPAQTRPQAPGRR